NPTTLSDYSDLRGEISFDTTAGKPVENKDVPGLFKKGGARFDPRAGFDVSFNFSGNIVQDRDKQGLIETGLAGVARAVFNLTSSDTGPVKKGSTSFLTLSLDQFGAHDGRYRFTSIAGAKANQIQIL